MRTKPSTIQTNSSCYYHNLAKPQLWMAYQSWRKLIYLHWAVDPEVVAPYIPKHKDLVVDTFDGKAWISVVAFEVYNAHMRFTPVLPGISSFTELNLRTYARLGDKAGTVFLRLDASNLITTLVYRMTGLPYHKANIEIRGQNSLDYKERIDNQDNTFDISWQISQEPYSKTALDAWLTERYCTYQQIGKKVYRYPICHKPMELQLLIPTEKSISYRWNSIILSEDDIALAHYSKGVDALFYMRQNIGKEKPGTH